MNEVKDNEMKLLPHSIALITRTKLNINDLTTYEVDRRRLSSSRPECLTLTSGPPFRVPPNPPPVNIYTNIKRSNIDIY